MCSAVKHILCIIQPRVCSAVKHILCVIQPRVCSAVRHILCVIQPRVCSAVKHIVCVIQLRVCSAVKHILCVVQPRVCSAVKHIVCVIQPIVCSAVKHIVCVIQPRVCSDACPVLGTIEKVPSEGILAEVTDSSRATDIRLAQYISVHTNGAPMGEKLACMLRSTPSYHTTALPYYHTTTPPNSIPLYAKLQRNAQFKIFSTGAIGIEETSTCSILYPYLYSLQYMIFRTNYDNDSLISQIGN